MRGLKAAAVAVLLVALPQGAGAQDFLSEVKVGVLAHDAPVLAHRKEHGVDVNLEALFASPDFLAAIWAPRPHVGGTISTEGDTSQLYAGLTWQARPLEIPVWGAFSLGGAVHDGKLHPADNDRKALGSRVLFRLAAEIGYDIDEHVRISLIWDHISNADLAEQNEGLNTLGIRLGYQF